MSYSKAKFFDIASYDQAFLAKAVCHPARIVILKMLKEKGKTPFKDLAETMPLSLPTVSQHVRILVKSNLILPQQIGANTFYQLNPDNCRAYFKIFAQLAGEIIEMKN